MQPFQKKYGLATSITKIREVAGTDKMGTNAYGMVKAAEQLGFTAKAIKENRMCEKRILNACRFRIFSRIVCHRPPIMIQ